jgi:hypothetical protein
MPAATTPQKRTEVRTVTGVIDPGWQAAPAGRVRTDEFTASPATTICIFTAGPVTNLIRFVDTDPVRRHRRPRAGGIGQQAADAVTNLI